MLFAPMMMLAAVWLERRHFQMMATMTTSTTMPPANDLRSPISGLLCLPSAADSYPNVRLLGFHSMPLQAHAPSATGGNSCQLRLAAQWSVHFPRFSSTTSRAPSLGATPAHAKLLSSFPHARWHPIRLGAATGHAHRDAGAPS